MSDGIYIPDPIERGEMRAEAWEEEIRIDDEHFKCPGCGTKTRWDDGHPSSADPYSPPICGGCLEEKYPELKGDELP
jgi:hypothetical protein